MTKKRPQNVLEQIKAHANTYHKIAVIVRVDNGDQHAVVDQLSSLLKVNAKIKYLYEVNFTGTMNNYHVIFIEPLTPKFTGSLLTLLSGDTPTINRLRNALSWDVHNGVKMGEKELIESRLDALKKEIQGLHKQIAELTKKHDAKILEYKDLTRIVNDWEETEELEVAIIHAVMTSSKGRQTHVIKIEITDLPRFKALSPDSKVLVKFDLYNGTDWHGEIESRLMTRDELRNWFESGYINESHEIEVPRESYEHLFEGIAEPQEMEG